MLGYGTPRLSVRGLTAPLNAATLHSIHMLIMSDLMHVQCFRQSSDFPPFLPRIVEVSSQGGRRFEGFNEPVHALQAGQTLLRIAEVIILSPAVKESRLWLYWGSESGRCSLARVYNTVPIVLISSIASSSRLFLSVGRCLCMRFGHLRFGCFASRYAGVER